MPNSSCSFRVAVPSSPRPHVPGFKLTARTAFRVGVEQGLSVTASRKASSGTSCSLMKPVVVLMLGRIRMVDACLELGAAGVFRRGLQAFDAPSTPLSCPLLVVLGLDVSCETVSRHDKVVLWPGWDE